MIQLALVDDHIITRNGLKNFIERSKEIKVVLEAGNGRELINQLAIADPLPEIILLDITMPEMNGFETIDWLGRKYPRIKVLIFSMLKEPDTVIHMIHKGACGFISKSSDPVLLVKAILAVAKSGFYLGGLVKKEFLSKENTRVRLGSFQGSHIISPKERDFIRLAASNLSYQEIALKMEVSPKTIENYRDSIFEKLEINNRAALVLYGFKTGLVDNFME